MHLVFMLGATWWMYSYLQQSVFNFPAEEAFYKIRIMAKPEEKERSMLCRVWVEAKYDSTTTTTVQRNAFIYITKDSSSFRLRQGDAMWIFSRLAPPENNRNFDEFDYRRYLIRKGIAATGFATVGNWGVVAHDSSFSLLRFASESREKLLTLYRKLGFEGDDLAVLSALTTGYKEELSEEIRESYSVAGASHILALSGLHIGLIYLLLLWGFRWLPHHLVATQVLRAILIIISLWAFACFTGFPASVVRSVSMFSIVVLGSLFQRKTFSLNTLAMAAFFMLLCRPAWLFDVGFQLSFCAVAAILILHPSLQRFCVLPGRVGKYLGGLISISIAAQLGTLPLIILYFSRISIHFLLTNLVVVPLVIGIVYIAVAMLVCTPFLPLQAGIACLLKILLRLLNQFVGWVEQLPYASIDNIWIYPAEALSFYLLLLLYMGLSRRRPARKLIICMSGILLLCSYHVISGWVDHPCRSLVFYNVRGCPAIHCIASSQHTWIAYADSLPAEERLRKAAGNFWRRQRLNEPHILTDGYEDSRLSLSHSILSFYNCRVCMVNDNRWANKTARQPLSIDYLYLCKGYSGQLDELFPLFTPSCVILDSSLSEYRKKSFSEECKRLGIRFLSLSEKGSVRFLL